ncbi:MAG: tetratricopeptide repeat protein [Planctomycetota bacterium]|jgi:PBP1b-binding outer membrane lipoprotein LpoB
MNMMKLNKQINILFLTFVAIFLFGCSAKQQQKESVETKPELASEDIQVPETVAEPAEEKKKEEKIEDVSEQQPSSQEIPDAQQKLMFAQNYLKMSQKGILSYSQAVAICRSIIKDYPETQYEQQARTLLGQVPDDLRSQFNITDEELEL